MKLHKSAVCVSLLLLTLAPHTLTQAAENTNDNFFMGLEFGTSQLDFQGEILDRAESIEDSGYAIGYFAGFKWQNNFVAQGTIAFSSNNIFFESFDFYEATELKLQLGYDFQFSEKFSIVPFIGVSSWDVDLKEGLFLNSDSDERIKNSGTDITYRVNVEYLLFSRTSLILSYAITSAAIGDIETSQLGVKFAF